MRILVLPLFVIALAATAHADIEKELSAIQGEMPGCGFGVVNNNILIYEQYEGYASLKYGIPIPIRETFLES